MIPFENGGRINDFNRINFEKPLRAALEYNFFNFNGKIFKQIDGVAMGLPLCPSLANTFLCFHELNAIKSACELGHVY